MRWFLLLIGLAACSSGDVLPGGECGPNGACPPGYACSSANRCVISTVVVVDGPVAVVDAVVAVTPDAAAPDAAPLPAPDSRPPDARPPAPDAAPPPPDARVDARVDAPPDARVDAAPPPDAPPPDARVDAPPPDVETRLDSTPTDPTRAATAVFTFSSPSAGATFECGLDGARLERCTSPATFPALADDRHTFLVRATAGGVTDGTPATFAWTVDTTGPTVTLTGPSGGAVTGRAVAFDFTAEAGARFTCALDGAALAACPTGHAAYTQVAGGPHTFHVRAADALGNPGPPATADFTVDATGPVVTIQPLPGDQSGRSGTISYGADEPATFACRRDLDPAFAPCPAAGYAFSGLAAGGHTLTVRASDTFANPGADASYTWTVTGPVSVTVMDGASPVSNAAVFGIGADLDAAHQTSGTTDAGGHVSLVVPPGGMVTTYVLHPQFSWAFTVVGVQPFEDVVIGPPESSDTIGPLHVQRTLPPLPAGTTCVEDDFDADPQGCVGVVDPQSFDLDHNALDASGKLDLLVGADDAFPHTLAFGWVPGIAVSPGVPAIVDVPAWLPAVDQTVTLAHVPSFMIATPGVAMRGQIILAFESELFVNGPAASVQRTARIPPPGVGERVIYRYAASSSRVLSDSPTFDVDDFLPGTGGQSFFTYAPLGTVGMTYSGGAGAAGIVTTLSWADGATFASTWTIVTPPDGRFTLPRLGQATAPRSGMSVTVTQTGLDVSSWSDADLRQGYRPLYRSVAIPDTPIPDLGAGVVVRTTQSSATISVP